MNVTLKPPSSVSGALFIINKADIIDLFVNIQHVLK